MNGLLSNESLLFCLCLTRATRLCIPFFEDLELVFELHLMTPKWWNSLIQVLQVGSVIISSHLSVKCVPKQNPNLSYQKCIHSLDNYLLYRFRVFLIHFFIIFLWCLQLHFHFPFLVKCHLKKRLVYSLIHW